MTSIESAQAQQTLPSPANVPSFAEVAPFGLPSPIAGEVTTKDEQIAELQEKLADVSDRRCEERFWWGLVVVGLLDCLILPSQPFLFMAVLLIVEFTAGVYFARRMGLEKVAELLDSAFKHLKEHIGKEK